MQKKTLLLISVAFICGMMTFFLYVHYREEKKQLQYVDSLTFENTQTWDPLFKQLAKNTDDSPDIILPLPPSNTSHETQNELRLLKSYEELRTPEKLAEIEVEIFLENTYFGSQTLARMAASNTRPYTYQLFVGVTQFEMCIIFNEKEKFNRVRPSFLDSTLTTAIEIPAHPAYPSGHATQAYLRAMVLAELDTPNTDAYSRAAQRISKNREIAGVHYPSDSRAGEILASQIFAQLMKNEDFLTLLTQAKAEW